MIHQQVAAPKVKQRLYHFYAEYREAGSLSHTFDGTIISYDDPFDVDFYTAVMARVADAMTPPRPADKVILRSLTLLAERDKPFTPFG